jgi:hypothetical protein
MVYEAVLATNVVSVEAATEQTTTATILGQNVMKADAVTVMITLLVTLLVLAFVK